MGVIFTNGINFYIKAVGWQELLVEVAALSPYSRLVLGGYELRACRLSLTEEDGVARATRATIAVVNHDLMVLSIDRFLDKGLLEDLPSDDDTVIVLLDIDLGVLK